MIHMIIFTWSMRIIFLHSIFTVSKEILNLNQYSRFYHLISTTYGHDFLVVSLHSGLELNEFVWKDNVFKIVSLISKGCEWMAHRQLLESIILRVVEFSVSGSSCFEYDCLVYILQPLWMKTMEAHAIEKLYPIKHYYQMNLRSRGNQPTITSFQLHNFATTIDNSKISARHITISKYKYDIKLMRFSWPNIFPYSVYNGHTGSEMEGESQTHVESVQAHWNN